MTTQSGRRLGGLSLAASLLVLTACSDASNTQAYTTGFSDTATGQEPSQETAQAAGQASGPSDAIAETAAGPATAGGSLLALSDVHLLANDAACPNRHCETSPSFWAETQTQMQTLVASANPDFILYLGDMPTHSSHPAAVRDEIFNAVLGGLANTASGTEIPVLYLPGNNDTLGLNADFYGLNDYCPFTEGGQSVFNSANQPSSWPVVNGSADIIDLTHRADGYYAARIPVGDTASHLRVLALNTNVFTSAYSLCSDTAAADGSSQLDWLAAQLADAATAREPVLLAMHVPPGVDGYRSPGQQDPKTMWDPYMVYEGSDAALQGRWMQAVMLDIIARHDDEITVLVGGHTHLNGIRRMHACDAAETVTELLVSVPGISTDHGNSPAVKHIQLGAALEPIEVTTYVANRGSEGLSWSTPLSYDFRTNYPNTTAPGTPLLAQIDSLDEEARLQGMLSYLYAHETVDPSSELADPGFFRQAMDVTCSQ